MCSTLLALLLTLPGAPVPRPRPIPVPPITPGIYVMTWGTTHYGTILYADGRYTATACRPGLDRPGRDRSFWGCWSYDQQSHTLHIHETCDGTYLGSFDFRLDCDWREKNYFRARKVH